tara:strand:+ start:1081 stop:1281 length:201 start_codon:yes stop_codon:yes gene_type:complete
MLVKPRYIGFREYLNIPEVTKLVDVSGFIGFIVVSDFLNSFVAEKIIIKPIIKNKNDSVFCRCGCK